MKMGLDVRGELAGAELGDPRLVRRLGSIAEAFAANPGASIPVAMGGVAEREAAYRFLSNRSVTLERVLEPHVAATVARAQQAQRVLVLSDTTEFTFSSERDGLGTVHGTKRNGFLGHFALAVSADGKRLPLGVLEIKRIVRKDKKPKRDNAARKHDSERESLRWLETAEKASRVLGDVEAVHVMDREADIFELMTGMIDRGRHFVIRSGQNRLVDGGGKLFESLQDADEVMEREVSLSPRARNKLPANRRSFPARSGRLARLRFAARAIEIRKAKSSCDPSLPAMLTVNVVRVYEPEPPAGQDAVEWRLFTTEPIDTAEQVAAIVDAYRARWVIEEYFKALKTGCAYETRQLESAGTLFNVLGILAVVAWQLLLLRSLARDASDRPATDALTTTQIRVLRAINRRRALPEEPTVSDAMTAIAGLGGHIVSNGSPGWIVLLRGFVHLLIAVEGFSAAMSITSCDQS